MNVLKRRPGERYKAWEDRITLYVLWCLAAVLLVGWVAVMMWPRPSRITSGGYGPPGREGVWDGTRLYTYSTARGHRTLVPAEVNHVR